MFELKVAPPRLTVLLMAVLHLWLGLIWWLSAPGRSSGLAFETDRHVGSLMSEQHPMWLWALAFTVIAAVLLVGVWGDDMWVAGAGCMLGSGLLIFYGVCSGWSALHNPTVAATGLAAFSVLGVWHALNAITLLGSARRRWG